MIQKEFDLRLKESASLNRNQTNIGTETKDERKARKSRFFAAQMMEDVQQEYMVTIVYI